MPDATCVLNRLRDLQRDIQCLASDRLTAVAVEGFQRRIEVLIRQLEALGEGERWCDLGDKWP